MHLARAMHVNTWPALYYGLLSPYISKKSCVRLYSLYIHYVFISNALILKIFYIFSNVLIKVDRDGFTLKVVKKSSNTILSSYDSNNTIF